MGWVNVATIPISDKWQFTEPIGDEIECIRIRNTLNSEPLFINYGYIAQVDNFRDFSGFRRIYPSKDNTVLEFKSPQAFTSRRIGVKKRNGVRSNFFWLVSIDAWVN